MNHLEPVKLEYSSEEPTPELYTQEALDTAHRRTRERLATLKVDADLPTPLRLDGLKSWGLSPCLPACSLVITFESVDTAIAARQQIGAHFGFPMPAEKATEPSRDPYKAECEGGSGGRCTQPDCEQCWPDDPKPEKVKVPLRDSDAAFDLGVLPTELPAGDKHD